MKFRSFFTNSAGIMLSRIAGFIRNLLMASVLGQTIYSDMFLVAFKLPNLFRRIFGEGAFLQSFLPSFVASRNKGVFAVSILRRFLLFITASSVIVALFPEFFTRLLVIGWTDVQVAETAPMMQITFWYLALVFIVTFLGSLLQYKEHFATTAFSTVLLNFAMIAALFIYRHDDPKQVAIALAVSVIVGGVMQVALHLYSVYRYKLMPLLTGGWKYRKQKDVKGENKKFNKLFIPAIWGNSTPQINAFLDTWLASFLVSGSISSLFYANQVFQLPLAIIAIAASTALFPSISKVLLNGREEEAYHNLAKAFWLMLAVLGVFALGGVIFSEAITWLLFERGKFTEADTEKTALVLSMYLVGLIPFGLAKLLSMYLYASHRHMKAAKIATVSLVFNVTASLVLMQYMGAAGLALAGSIGGWILFSLTLREVGFRHVSQILFSRNTALLLVGIAILGALFYEINLWLMEWIRG
ncbi:MAG: murein biosynthesis integral membrane protein MurJ [Sulfurovum sp.]|nr:murein biosynthesis integral membrane protein MurJ [Sulfurovum sp.]